MKKIILTGCLAVAALFTSTATAQTFADVTKPTAENPFSVEVGLSGVSGITGGSGTGINWNAPSLRFRYFLQDNFAVRLQLSLGDGSGQAMSETSRFYENTDGTGGEGTQEISRSAVAVQIGAEYHFLGTQKLDPYAALGINFGGGKQTATLDQTDGSSYVGVLTVDQSGGYSVFGATLGLGMDFYFVENVYIGAELGLGFNAFNYSDSENTQTITPTTGDPIVTESVTAGYKESYLGTQAAVRIGWRF